MPSTPGQLGAGLEATSPEDLPRQQARQCSASDASEAEQQPQGSDSGARGRQATSRCRAARVFLLTHKDEISSGVARVPELQHGLQEQEAEQLASVDLSGGQEAQVTVGENNRDDAPRRLL